MIYANKDGYVYYYPDVWINGEMVISRLYVTPPSRGHKAGYALLDHVKQFARDNGFKALKLSAFPLEANNELEREKMLPRLIKYYRAYGFRSSRTAKARMKLKIKA